jgi:GrpB-like predicted nucleotidyltransferase (UPF0157 family)
MPPAPAMQVHVLPFSPAWAANFATVAAQLRAVLTDPGTAIEHIGSTAVPGLCAKPVIDVLVGVPSLPVVEAATPALAAAGFDYIRKYEVELPSRRYFVKPAGDGPRVHVHAVCTGSDLWRQHIAFRDALRANPALRHDYAQLKLALAHQHAQDKAAYTLAKAPFIQAALASMSTQARPGP